MSFYDDKYIAFLIVNSMIALLLFRFDSLTTYIVGCNLQKRDFTTGPANSAHFGGGDVRVLVKTMEEKRQLRRFTRVFPTPASHAYLTYLGRRLDLVPQHDNYDSQLHPGKMLLM